jgi:hypothetical protein
MYIAGLAEDVAVSGLLPLSFAEVLGVWFDRDALGATAVHVIQTFSPLKLYVTHMCRHANSSTALGLPSPIVAVPVR